MTHRLKHRQGFAMLEVLLTIAIITIIAGTGIPVYQSFQNRNELDIATTTIAQTLRRAQILSSSVDSDTSWGVYVQNGSIVLFKGPSYATRDSAYDELFDLTTSITVSGLFEVVFTKFTGIPQATGSILFASPNNETRTVTINVKGMVSY